MFVIGSGSEKPNQYKTNTALFAEMEAAMSGHLGLAEWGALPWWERKLWMYFWILRNEKERYQVKEAEIEAEAKAARERKVMESQPKLAAMPRPRLQA